MRTRLKDLFKNQPLHLLFFPVLFVLNHFISIAVPNEILTAKSAFPIAFNFIGGVIFCTVPPFLFYKIVSRKVENIKASILITIIFLPFFFFQDLFLSTEEMMVGVRLRWLLPVLAVVLIVLIYLILKSRRSFNLLNEGLNVGSSLLVLYGTFALVWSFNELKPKSFGYTPQTLNLSCNECPDVYFLILDSYTSDKSLRDYFSCDNSSFTNGLNNLGFEVADQMIAPYSTTGNCIGSILNLNQVTDLKRYKNIFGVNEIIRLNSVTKSFQKAGYSIHNYSLFDIGDQPKYYSLSPSFGSLFVNGVSQTSMLGMGFRFYQDQNFYDIHVAILNKMRSLANEKSSSPNFFYGHIMAPHPPFVIDSAGNSIDFLKRRRHRINAGSYVNQVMGLNKLVLASVHDVLQKSPNSIIIIMGDHGYRFAGKPDEAYTVFLAYKGPHNKEISSLSSSSKIFEVVFKEFNTNP